MRDFHFRGSRIVKTGLAIFLTAVICEWLNWPPVFAVITAIVTIEPTISDSFKKGMVRFPASAIGSAYAVLFIALFGNSPITYTLAAVLTILTCYRLKLHAGLLVATLTAVAMVEVIHSNFFIAFFIRLGTTTIGLLVSMGINMFVFPPDYKKDILENIQGIGQRAGTILGQTFHTILYDNQVERTVDKLGVQQLYQEIKKTEILIRFQSDESKLHPLVGGDEAQFLIAEKQLAFLHNLDYHLDNLIYMPFKKISWSTSERDIIMHAVDGLVHDLQHPQDYDYRKHELELKHITDLFWEDNEEITKGNEVHPTRFPPELIILYELVTIYNLVDRFYNPYQTKSSHEAEEKQ